MNEDEFDRLRREIVKDVTPFQAEHRHRELTEQVAFFSDSSGDAGAARYLEVLLDVEFKRIAIPDALASLDAVIESPGLSGDVLLHSLVLAARLGVGVEEHATNASRRDRAFQLAQSNGQRGWALGILVNWIGAESSWGRYDRMSELLVEFDEYVASLPVELVESPGNREPVSRAMVLRAQLVLRSDPDPVVAVETAVDLYRQAVIREASDIERRFNYLADLAEQLVLLGTRHDLSEPIRAAGFVLDIAKRSLDAHNCWRCRAYFAYVSAFQERGEARMAASVRSAFAALTRPLATLTQAHEEIAAMNHPLGESIDSLAADIRAEMTGLDQPNRIFLSHAGANKELVVDFYEALESVGFKPWMDVKNLNAGDPLHRSLLAGMQASCAAVFFITPEFKDEKYLAQEVDWALGEKIRRPEFVIVTIVLNGASSEKVPQTLRTYVWKEPSTDIAALREIVRALPLRVIEARPATAAQ